MNQHLASSKLAQAILGHDLPWHFFNAPKKVLPFIRVGRYHDIFQRSKLVALASWLYGMFYVFDIREVILQMVFVVDR